MPEDDQEQPQVPAEGAEDQAQDPATDPVADGQGADQDAPQDDEAPAQEPEPEVSTKAQKPTYDVLVNNGNGPNTSIVSLNELGDIAKSQLADSAARQVTLTVKVIMTQGELGAERADGVK